MEKDEPPKYGAKGNGDLPKLDQDRKSADRLHDVDLPIPIKINPVSIKELFRYASWFDVSLMSIGLICAGVSGAGVSGV